MACTSCKISFHSHVKIWVLGRFILGGGGEGGGPLTFRRVVQRRQSPDFRSPEVGISGEEPRLI